MTQLSTRFSGRAPFDETWFLEVTGADGQGFWLRHTLSAGAHGEAGVWATHFSGDRVRGWHAPGPTHEVEHEPGVLFRREDAELTPTRARGRCGDVTWDLTLHGGGVQHRHVPRVLERLGLGRTYEPAILDLTVQGTVTVQGVTVPMTSGRGVLGHLHGRKNRVEQWAWCHASGFAGAPGVIFEALSARLAVGPPLTSMALLLPDRALRLSSPMHLVTSASTHGVDRWHAVGRVGRTRVTATMTLPTTGVALAAYHDADGRPSWCRNAVTNRLVVRIDDPGASTTLVTNQALGELGGREHPGGAVTVPPG